MCAVREQFDSYRACDSGTDRMANDDESKIVRVGFLCICMFDGVVRTLIGVRYVPN